MVSRNGCTSWEELTRSTSLRTMQRKIVRGRPLVRGGTSQLGRNRREKREGFDEDDSNSLGDGGSGSEGSK